MPICSARLRDCPFGGRYVLCDEVYLPLENTESFMSMVDVYERAIVTNSLSKTYSTPAARVAGSWPTKRCPTASAPTAITP